MTLLDYFDRCYVVNLPERADRRREMQQELIEAGIPFAPGRVELFTAVRPVDAGLFPSLGARGCFESHHRILRQARTEGLRNVLVMEDDLTIDPRLRAHAAEMIETLRTNDWGFVYFGHALEQATPSGDPALLQPYSGPLMTTHFYGINAAIFDRLLDFFDALLQRPPGHPDGSPMHVDGAYSTFRKQNPDVLTLITVPSLGGQRSSRSDIYPNRWFDRWPVFRELAALARRVRSRWKAGRRSP
ncbi:glycosyltransferase family 25 protein [Methylotetracoccus oryzae]|uniref:glycosyltransferase family 25 protein n=1 Tax=Methylotetracoccus oryzae TaxID=1919059 RepID=UPI001F47E9BF|nr:glycosyltransferase family 25 protein [Methylotetracoccus oryzae]